MTPTATLAQGYLCEFLSALPDEQECLLQGLTHALLTWEPGPAREAAKWALAMITDRV